MRYLLPILLVASLGACDSGSKDHDAPSKKSDPAVVTSEPAAKPVEPALSTAPEPAVPTPAEPLPSVPDKAAELPVKPVAPRKVEKPVEKVTQALPKTKLDLSLPPELAKQLNAEDLAVEEGLQPILPPLFEEKKPSLNPFQVSGKLITGDNAEDYWDSVEGAELQFEFRR